MDIEEVKRTLGTNRNLVDTLGIQLISTPEEDTCEATMPVDEHSRQPFGYLSGGASLAFAETLAGAGSLALCPGMACLGIHVAADHLKAVPEGGMVRGVARIIHKGELLHTWRVDIFNGAGELVSSASVTNCIIRPKEKE
jgi:uncharacterized protein (TIGR00369 family)